MPAPKSDRRLANDRQERNRRIDEMLDRAKRHQDGAQLIERAERKQALLQARPRTKKPRTG